MFIDGSQIIIRKATGSSLPMIIGILIMVLPPTLCQLLNLSERYEFALSASVLPGVVFGYLVKWRWKEPDQNTSGLGKAANTVLIGIFNTFHIAVLMILLANLLYIVLRAFAK